MIKGMQNKYTRSEKVADQLMRSGAVDMERSNKWDLKRNAINFRIRPTKYKTVQSLSSINHSV